MWSPHVALASLQHLTGFQGQMSQEKKNASQKLCSFNDLASPIAHSIGWADRSTHTDLRAGGEYWPPFFVEGIPVTL